MHCVICDNPFSEFADGLSAETMASGEHIIPEALGGRREAKYFLCKGCNESAGSKWDIALISQLHPLRLLFGVKRQKGETPGMFVKTTHGEELWMKPGGGFAPRKPIVSESVTDKGISISITARTIAEAKKITSGFKRKYPQIDLENALATAEV